MRMRSTFTLQRDEQRWSTGGSPARAVIPRRQLQLRPLHLLRQSRPLPRPLLVSTWVYVPRPLHPSPTPSPHPKSRHSGLRKLLVICRGPLFSPSLPHLLLHQDLWIAPNCPAWPPTSTFARLPLQTPWSTVSTSKRMAFPSPPSTIFPSMPTRSRPS